MSVISGDGFSVHTEALRSDADTWDEQAVDLKKGREKMPDPSSCDVSQVRGDKFVVLAYELLGTYATYCCQGEEQFVGAAESLRNAAKDYENNEDEVF